MKNAVVPTRLPFTDMVLTQLPVVPGKQSNPTMDGHCQTVTRMIHPRIFDEIKLMMLQ